MPEKFEQNKIQADPSKFSLLEDKLELVKQKRTETEFSLIRQGVGREIPIFLDKHTGEKFYKIPDDQHPEYQKLLSLILKGTINVSDIVKVGNDYYSHGQNMANIESKDNVITETKADIFILSTVFRDTDHQYYPAESYNRQQTEQRYGRPVLHHHNVLINEVGNKANFFDFSMAGEFPHSRSFNDIAEFKKNLHQLLKMAGEIKSEEASVVRSKVKLLLNHYNENNFSDFKKIVQKSGVEMTESEIKEFFKNLRLRLEALDEILTEKFPSINNK